MRIKRNEQLLPIVNGDQGCLFKSTRGISQIAPRVLYRIEVFTRALSTTYPEGILVHGIRYRKDLHVPHVSNLIFTLLQARGRKLKQQQSGIVNDNGPLRDWSLITGRGGGGFGVVFSAEA